MEKTMNSLAWFEIPVVDFERAMTFYSKIFHFEMPSMQMGPNLMGFLPFDQNRGVDGAIVNGEGYIPSQSGTLVYLSGGADLTVVLDRVDDADGTVLLGKTQISPHLGYYALFLDSEGNRLALRSPA